jgi:hypothetical protein
MGRGQPHRTVLDTDRRNLGIERQVPASVALANGLGEQAREPGARRQHPQARALQQAIERRQRLRDSRRGIQDAGVGDHAHELAQAEHRHGPWGVAFREFPQTPQGSLVMRETLPMRVHEHA